MAQPAGEPRPQFNKPFPQIWLMLGSLVLAGAGVFVALPQVLPVFEANPLLNSFIGLIFAFGVSACFYQVAQLYRSVRWIETFVLGESDESTRVPSMLAPLATLLRTRGARMQLNSTSTRSNATWNRTIRDSSRSSTASGGAHDREGTTTAGARS